LTTANVGELLDPDELGVWTKSWGRLARNSDKYPRDHPISIQRRFHIKAGGAITRFRKDLDRDDVAGDLPLEWVDWMTEEILRVLAELRDKALTNGTQTNGTHGEGGDSP
jgi:hypothetical protein